VTPLAAVKRRGVKLRGDWGARLMATANGSQDSKSLVPKSQEQQRTEQPFGNRHPRLLRPRGKRPRGCRTTHKPEKFAPLHVLGTLIGAETGIKTIAAVHSQCRRWVKSSDPDPPRARAYVCTTPESYPNSAD
jgi:hypothetical protein